MLNSGISFRKLPVYKFHRVSAQSFEALAKYLSRHKYKTWFCDELLDYCKGSRIFPEGVVVLTFDDGDSSVWSFVYPLLEKYGLKATVFVQPEWLSDNKTPRPNFNDYWQGKATLAEVREAGTNSPFISWPEASQMQKSGFVDIQSHTLKHQRCWIDSEIIDFQHSASCGQPRYTYLFTAIDAKADAQLRGCPVYKNASRMVARRYFDDVALRQECLGHVRKNGGLSFFHNQNWKKRLYQVVADYKIKHPCCGHFESESEQKKVIIHSLSKSKQMIEFRLGKTCVHLAYPWGEANITTLSYAKQAGYLTNFFTETLPFSQMQIDRSEITSPLLITRFPGLTEYSYLKDKFYKPKRLFSLLKKTFSGRK